MRHVARARLSCLERFRAQPAHHQLRPILQRHATAHLQGQENHVQGGCHDWQRVGYQPSAMAPMDIRLALHRGPEDGAGRHVLHSVHRD